MSYLADHTEDNQSGSCLTWQLSLLNHKTFLAYFLCSVLDNLNVIKTNTNDVQSEHVYVKNKKLLRIGSF